MSQRNGSQIYSLQSLRGAEAKENRAYVMHTELDNTYEKSILTTPLEK